MLNRKGFPRSGIGHRPRIHRASLLQDIPSRCAKRSFRLRQFGMTILFVTSSAGDNSVSVPRPIIRRFLSILSACVVAASILAYLCSFFGAPVDMIMPWFIPVFLGWMVLLVHIWAIEYPASRKPSFAWKGFARGMPNWVAPLSWILQLFFIANFVWLAVHFGMGAPAIMDGQYVLDSHGQILKVLTHAEYFTLKEVELRTFAALMVFFYFVPMTYWWYRRT